MSSFNSSEIEDQFTVMFQGAMEEAMSIMKVKEAATVAASSSTRGSKCRQ
jgi:hypothetical protein